MKNFLTVVAVLFSLPVAAETTTFKELYMPNDAGGFVVLTVEDCADKSKAALFPYYTYATNAKGEVVEQGCWMSPDATDALTNVPEGARVVYIFNLRYGNETHTLPQHYFSPEKKRWAEPEFKGDV